MEEQGMKDLEETLQANLITGTYRAANGIHEVSCKDKINHYQYLHSLEAVKQRNKGNTS